MDEDSKSFFLSRPNWIEKLTLAVVIMGGILGYILIDRYRVEESKTRKELNEAYTKIANLELAVKGEKDKLELERGKLLIQESKAGRALTEINTKIASLDLAVKGQRDNLELERQTLQLSLYKLEAQTKLSVLAEFLNNCAPNIELNMVGNDFVRAKSELTINYSLRNMGKFSCVVDKPEIIVATEEISDAKPAEVELKEGKDYSLKPPIIIGYFPPNKTNNCPVEITFKKDLPPKTQIVVKAIFTVKTHEQILKIAKRLTEDSMTKEELFEISKKTYAVITRY
jgi:hypothetical protein